MKYLHITLGEFFNRFGSYFPNPINRDIISQAKNTQGEVYKIIIKYKIQISEKDGIALGMSEEEIEDRFIESTELKTDGIVKSEIIEKVTFSGKWIEFIFKGKELKENEKFHSCGKTYELENAIENACLSDEIAINGLKGKTVIFELIGTNWKILGIRQ